MRKEILKKLKKFKKCKINLQKKNSRSKQLIGRRNSKNIFKKLREKFNQKNVVSKI